MNKYIEVAYLIRDKKKSNMNRNKIILLSELLKQLNNSLKVGLDMYRSVYTYDEDIVEHMKIAKTISSFKGKYYLERIIFDIDKKDNTDEVTLEAAKQFYDLLITEWQLDPYHIHIFFSGRGYHFTIPDIFQFTASNNLPELLKATITKYFPMVDPSIYVTTGLIRVPYSINTKTNLHKIELTKNELLKLKPNEIFELAKSSKIRKFSIEERTGDEYSIKPEIIYQHDLIVIDAPTKPETKVSTETSNIITCMQKLYDRGSKAGRRHTDMLRLISAYRRQGVPKNGILAMMQTWAPDMEKAEIKKIVNDTYAKAYQYSCKDTVMKEFCSDKCIFFPNKSYLINVHSSEAAEQNYMNFIRSDFSKKTFNLLNIFGIKNKEHLIIPTDYIYFFGDTGLGKTALMQQICISASHLKILYLTLEFTMKLLYRRFIQIKMGVNKEEVEKYYLQNSNGFSNEIPHIYTIDKAPDVIGLRKLIIENNPGMVIIDTIGKLKTNTNDLYQKTYMLGDVMKDLAEQFNLIIIAVHHISKQASSQGKINQHSGLGSQNLESQADEVWAIKGDPMRQDRIFSIEKARDRNKFTASYRLDNNTFRPLFLSSSLS